MVKISDAELEVMKVIWEKKEVTSSEIINELKHCNWNDNTVRTLINRLIAKRAVGIAKREGKTYTYVPLIKENEYKLKRSKKFIKQIYNGSINDMILNFIDNKELSKSELDNIISSIDKETKKRGD